MKSTNGNFILEIPRDRNSSFESEIVKKNQIHMLDEIENKMLFLFGLGNSYEQISQHIKDMYGISFPKSAITAVTKLIPLLNEWKKKTS